MKVKRFNIPLYGYGVSLIEVETKDDAKIIRKELKRNRIDPEDISQIEEEIIQGKFNGGYTYRHQKSKMFCVILFPCTSPAQRLNTLGHEKRHIEDRLAQYVGIDDIEAMGYIAGFLTEKLFA
ncbi:hypothetical protein [Draconibacterium mangrovi]|uniref:hypothetical protein n=1 Tax=Draconibacterium mangrovi TaxID=2697469 RepID=UPI0013D78FD5|nr:hypothetical protein [Draconibacterium mangrovi]